MEVKNQFSKKTFPFDRLANLGLVFLPLIRRILSKVSDLESLFSYLTVGCLGSFALRIKSGVFA